jgi:hypothetical protein
MWCLWKVPSYADYDGVNDPFATEDYFTKLYARESSLHPFVPYEMYGDFYYVADRATADSERLCDTSDP